jgi:hypothetical protein
VVSTDGSEEGRFQVFCEKVQRRQQEVVEKEVSVITELLGSRTRRAGASRPYVFLEDYSLPSSLRAAITA